MGIQREGVVENGHGHRRRGRKKKKKKKKRKVKRERREVWRIEKTIKSQGSLQNDVVLVSGVGLVFVVC